MNVNYIYNSKGNAEYAVIPIVLWNKISNLINDNETTPNKELTDTFQPSEYKGILSNLNIVPEIESAKIRAEWKRTI